MHNAQQFLEQRPYQGIIPPLKIFFSKFYNTFTICLIDKFLVCINGILVCSLCIAYLWTSEMYIAQQLLEQRSYQDIPPP